MTVGETCTSVATVTDPRDGSAVVTDPRDGYATVTGGAQGYPILQVRARLAGAGTAGALGTGGMDVYGFPALMAGAGAVASVAPVVSVSAALAGGGSITAVPALSTSVTVSYANPSGRYSMALAVRVITGASAVQPGGTEEAGNWANGSGFTVEQTGSLVYFTAITRQTGDQTATSGFTLSTVNYTASDGTQERYLLSRSSAPTSATGNVNPIHSAAGDLTYAAAVAEILGGGSIAEDASTPALAGNGTDTAGTGSVSSAFFFPPPGALLVACLAGESQGFSSFSVSDSLGLTWTQQIEQPTDGTAAIYTAWVPS